MSLPTSLLALASLLLACPAGIAQCKDPKPPRSGFTPKFIQNQSVTYSDGYKTLANVLYPDTTPPSCGWPLLVLVHGLSGSRNTGSLEAYALVSQGFFVVTYDVRGQGDARKLNSKPTMLWALDQWIDLAEIIEWTAKTYVGRVDSKRVAVFGDSQGAVHAWAAAAWSGKNLPTNTRRSTKFPEIKCVVPRYFDPHVVDAFTLDGSAFLYYLAGFGFQFPNPVVDLDPKFRTQITGAINAGDASTLAAYLRTIPGMDFVSLLEQTKVPILTFAGWQDTWSDPRGILALLDKLPQATPRRCYLTTGPHGMPLNVNQVARQVFLTESWFKRWLKNADEPTEKGPPYSIAQMPSTNTDYLSPVSLWRHRAISKWPPKEAVSTRYYLDVNDKLSTSKPMIDEGQSTISHTVSGNYDPAGFVADAGNLAKVRAKIPERVETFTSAAFAKDVEIACIPKVRLSVESTAKRIVLGVRISVVDGVQQRVLSTGGAGVSFGTIPGSKDVEIEMSPLATIVEKGQKLRFQISNFDLQTPDTSTVWRRLPSFKAFDARVRHNAVQLSWVDLGQLPRVAPSITSSETTISVTNPKKKTFQIRSSSEWKDGFYVILLGFSGEGPPQVFPNGSELWMVPDSGTFAFAAAINTPVQLGFGGVLDKNGEAKCTLDLGLIQGGLPIDIVGLSMTVGPTFFTFARGFEAGTHCRLRFR